ncbi:SLAP domain-containing protein [Brevibacillus sp. SYP-B805]|uniref:SLAP domain-containing protein n=1 Tax=Brevibacillus sp. SYP-B805 TaxID=1578199 RepID=UPI0013ED35A6|nr:SLAP domain-containing protein [Brevibacillus sp. SYP-B805]NGQ95614.1 SLAP domain-containing protein [Brevibacillus sp. SYP-B805]
MSWLLENWFGTKESLEQVREDIREHLQREWYLGVSGLDQPELSANRVDSREMSLILVGPWENRLEEVEEELIQFIHDELPPVVRDEVGIFPFFANVVREGYLVLAFLRNATKRDILIQKLPLALVTPDGEVVARKSFDLMSLGAVGKFASRPCEFLFRWEEFSRVPEQEVPLTLVYEGRPKKRALPPSAYAETNGLSAEEVAKYMQVAEDKIKAVPGEVDLQVIDIAEAEEGGLKVIVLFRNGLEKRLEFTEVPILIQDQKGREVARVHYELQNLHVDAGSSRMWTFHVPKDSLKAQDINPAECTAYIPDPKPRKEPQGAKGLVQ